VQARAAGQQAAGWVRPWVTVLQLCGRVMVLVTEAMQLSMLAAPARAGVLLQTCCQAAAVRLAAVRCKIGCLAAETDTSIHQLHAR
jgi:hypothetical protein